MNYKSVGEEGMLLSGQLVRFCLTIPETCLLLLTWNTCRFNYVAYLDIFIYFKILNEAGQWWHTQEAEIGGSL